MRSFDLSDLARFNRRAILFSGLLIMFSAHAQSQPGSIDPGFNVGSGADGAVYALAVQLDGKVLVGGAFTHFNGTVQNHIARLNADGSIDPNYSVGAGPDADVHTLTVQPDGKILVAGRFKHLSGT